MPFAKPIKSLVAFMDGIRGAMHAYHRLNRWKLMEGRFYSMVNLISKYRSRDFHSKISFSHNPLKTSQFLRTQVKSSENSWISSLFLLLTGSFLILYCGRVNSDAWDTSNSIFLISRYENVSQLTI